MTEEESIKDLRKKLLVYINGNRVSPTVINITIFSLLFNYTRFHDFSGMRIFGIIRLPIILTFISGFLVLFSNANKNWPKQLKLMLFVLTLEAVRTFLGFLVFQDLVLNDAWQYFTWLDLCFHFIGIAIPLALAFNSGTALRKIINFYAFSALLLSIWGITHSGFGPGGHIGDENDLCLVLIFLLPFAFMCNFTLASKARGVSIGILAVLGIVATKSRGGFLGFVALALSQFLSSSYKIKWIITCLILAAAIIPFVPSDYYSEVKSIQSDATADTGTINERIKIWKIVIRMWKDPKNTLQGVGLENSKWNFNNYQEVGAGQLTKSLVGRSTHNLYFQILGDQGLFGILMFIMFLYTSITQLRVVKKSADLLLKRMPKLFMLIKNRNEETLDDYRFILKKLEEESNLLLTFSKTMLCSFLGALVTALGISVNYYPTFWMMYALSAAIYAYWNNIEGIYNQVRSELEKQ